MSNSREIRINLIAKDDVSGRLHVISVNAEKTAQTLESVGKGGADGLKEVGAAADSAGASLIGVEGPAVSVSEALDGTSTSATEAGSALQQAGTDGAQGMEQVSTAAERTSQSLERSAVVAGAFGAAILSALVVPIGMGTKAAWDQVDAVEQATLAFRAYETDARKVNKVLEELVAYAQSDLGRLFQRQELFAAAQGLKVMGAETENLTRYVEIMGRSVSIGAGTWDELVRVIGRVGAQARLSGVDFDMLTKMGFQLDESLRNQAITWEELFAALDRGIGIVDGMTDTIQGQMTLTTSAIRALGIEFLGIDSSSRFAAQSLGELAFGALATTRDLLAELKPVAHGAGEALAFFGGGAKMVVEWMLSWPDWLKTYSVSVIGGLGALTVGASATVVAFSRLSAAGTALNKTMHSLAATTMRHPILFIAAVVGGVALSAWARHRDSVQRAQEAYAALGDEMKETDEIIASLKLDGHGAMAAMMEEMRDAYRGGLADLAGDFDQYGDGFMDLLFGDLEQAHTRAEAGAKVKEFLNSSIGQAALEWAQENDKEYAKPILNAIGLGSSDALAQATPFIKEMMNDYVKAFELDNTQLGIIEDQMNNIFDLMRNPDIDAGAIFEQFWSAFGDYKVHGVFEQFIADLQEIETGAYKVAEATRQLRAETTFLIDMAGLRLSGQGSLADDLEQLNAIMGSTAESSERAGLWFEFLESKIRSGDLALDAMALDLQRINYMWDEGYWSQSQYDAALEIVTRKHVAVAVTANEAEVAFNRLENATDGMTDAIRALNAELQQAFIDNMNALLDVAGYGDPLSSWNLAGNATDMSLLAMNTQHAGTALDTVFRVVVGNTDAIGKQVDSVQSWIDGLMTWSDSQLNIHNLLAEGFIQQEDYNRALEAQGRIQDNNAHIQRDILTMQTLQAPLIAEQTDSLRAYLHELSYLPAQQQLIALGWMDSATAARAMEFQTLAVAAATGQLGVNGEQAFTAMITGAAQADPILKALLIDMGLISEGTNGTIRVHLDGVEGALSEIDRLTVAMVTLMDFLDDNEINESVTFELLGLDDPRKEISDLDRAIRDIPDRKIIEIILDGPGIDPENPLGPGLGSLVDALSDAIVVQVGADTAEADQTISDLTNNAPTVTIPVDLDLSMFGGASAGSLGSSLGSAAASAFAGITIPVAMEVDESSVTSMMADYQGRDGETLASMIVWAIGNDESAANMISMYQARDSETLASMNVWAIGDDESASNMISHYQGRDQESLASMIVWAIGNGESASNMIDHFQGFDGSTLATTYVDVVTRTRTDAGRAHGGLVRKYAMGGYVPFRGGELGPEIAHFANGGTALLPRDGLYTAPAGTYISPNNAVSNSYGGNITIDLSGAVFNNTSREEMNEWAAYDLLPAIREDLSRQRVGQGVM